MSAVYLITSGAGNLACQLTFQLKSGEQIILFDVAEAPIAAVAETCAYVRGDITDPRALQAVFENHRPSKVIHAASILSGQSERDRRLAWRVNMDATYELFEMASDRGCAILFPSSVAAYGRLTCGPLDPGAEQQQWP